MMSDDTYISRPEAAKMLGVHPNTILNLRKRGILTDVRIGDGPKNRPGQGRYIRAEVEALMANVPAGSTDPRLEASVMYVLSNLPHHHTCAQLREEVLPCTCWQHLLRESLIDQLKERLNDAQEAQDARRR